MPQNREIDIDRIIDAQLKINNGCVNFSNIPLSKKDMLRIYSRLKDNENIRSLELRHCSLNLESALPLVNLAQTNKHILDIDLTGNQTGFEIEFDVVAALEKNKKSAAPTSAHKIEFGVFKSAKSVNAVDSVQAVIRKDKCF